jgi:hypothetical protein
MDNTGLTHPNFAKFLEAKKSKPVFVNTSLSHCFYSPHDSKERGSEKRCVVYLLKLKNFPLIKIGITNSPSVRLDTLRLTFRRSGNFEIDFSNSKEISCPNKRIASEVERNMHRLCGATNVPSEHRNSYIWSEVFDEEDALQCFRNFKEIILPIHIRNKPKSNLYYYSRNKEL